MRTIINKSEFRGLSPDSTLDDATLVNYLKTVTDLIKTYAGHSLEEDITIDYKLGTGSRYLYLSKRPVTAISEIIVNDTTLTEDQYRYDDCKIELVTGIFRKGQDFGEATAGRTTKSDQVKVTYTAGFVYPPESDEDTNTSDVPWDLKMAVAGMINSFAIQMKSGGMAQGLKSYSISDISYSFRSYAETSGPFMDTLERYLAW